jgi:sugar phosphate isomerase/epimerase
MTSMTSATTTGFPIAFRKGWSPWQQDPAALAAFQKQAGFAAVDMGNNLEFAQKFVAAGGRIGSADLTDWPALISPDAAKRKDAAAKNIAHITELTKLGVSRFFLVMLPEKPELPRHENFGYMVEGFGPILQALDKTGGAIAIEGWPGPGALACTPEGIRAFHKALPNKSNALNYDPSHLMRMGICPIRFLNEFISRVVHVHAKDCDIDSERQYLYGTEQPPTFPDAARPFGANHWQYTIPGHGQIQWTKTFSILKAANYTGLVAVELEDGRFNGTEAGEKKGLTLSLDYLKGC